MKQTAVEWLLEKISYQDKDNFIYVSPIINKKDIEQAKEMEKKQGYSDEDMEIVEISSIDANYIPHYQTKEGQLLATKFNVKQF